ncbi:MAG: aldehyde dehydrogenase [Comamonadaceae bacterium]|nr:MAG: aldehyde dehydrogenase [Comamonadaceae bacterium]
MTTSASQDTRWIDAVAQLKIDGKAFIDGHRVHAATEEQFDSHSPIDGRLLARVARCGSLDVDLAVKAARAAFDKRVWSGQSPSQRKKVLVRFAQLLEQAKEEMALLETLDMGKPIGFSLSFDLGMAVDCLSWFGEAVDKIYDEVAPTGSNSLALITREAVGVVGAIVPWNYPLLMALWKVAPALAAGNSVVLKPSEKSPLTALRLAEIAVAAGIPSGVFNVVPGYGHEAGKALALHPDVDCIAFTGSTKVGKQMFEYAGQSNLKRVWTELGGKSPNIVFADCPNLDAAVQTAIGGMFFNQGESCNAPSRLFIERSIKDEFMERAMAMVPGFMPGNPLSDGCTMGAIVDQVQLKTVLRFIQQGQDEGARLLTGGKQVLAESGGFYVEPTIFDNVESSMSISREEIFGPVLSVFSFDTAEQAIAQANDSIYGLQGAVWTSNLNKAHQVARALRVGTVHVNQYGQDDITVPFGGFKQSGNGRDKSLHALDKYSELKTTWIALG